MEKVHVMCYFFCFQLEKVLQQGDIGECADPYIKEEKVKKNMKTLQMIFNIYFHIFFALFNPKFLD